MIFNIKQKSFLKIIFICLLFFVFSKTSFASGKIYFTSSSNTLAPNGEFVVSVMLDAPEAVNAIDLEISYSSGNFKFLDFNNAGSIIDFWQSQPTLTKEGKIKLSGGSMTGFKGNSGLIIKIYFKALSAGESKINFTGKNLYLADGKGTLSIPAVAPLLLSVKDGAPETTLTAEFEEYKNKDNTPPDIVLTLVKNPKENSSLIVFNVTDKESGVKETQMRFKKWFAFSPWIPAQNPVLYPAGVWVIELKAMNNAELESINTLEMPWRIWKKFLFILLPIIFLVFLFISLYNKYKRII